MKIQLKGIKRNTPSGLSEDGEMEEMVNLRFKDGAFRPIPARTAIFPWLAYSNVYVHSNSGYKHYLGVKTTAAHDNVYTYIGAWSSGTTYTLNQAVLYNSAYYYLNTGTTIGTPPGYGNWVKLPDSAQVVNGTITIHIDEVTELYFFAKDIDNIPTQITPILIYQVGKLATFTQIGNVININDEDGLKHAIWYDSAYVVIGSNFDGTQTDTELIGKVDLKVDGIEDENNFIETMTAVSDSIIDKDTPLDTKKTLFKSLINKSNSILHADGKLKGYFLAQTAIELYDGTLIMHSPVVLLCQSWDINTRYNFSAEGNNFDYINNKAKWRMNQGAYSSNSNDPSWVVIKPDHIDELYTIDNYSGVDIHGVSAPVGGYKFPNTLISVDEASTNGDVNNREIRACVYSIYNKLKFKINRNIDIEYKPLIKSISIYVTKDVEPNDLESIALKERFFDQTSSANLIYERWEISQKTNTDIIKELADNQTFYKVHEIPFDDIVEGSTSSTAITPGDWIDIDLKGKLGDNLLTQEVLPYDNFSHHQNLPEVQFVYNSKLHVGNYKTLLSHGFPASHMFAHQGIGQFPNTLYSYDAVFYYIEVSIKTNNGISKVVRYANASEFMKFGMLSYPDSRATSITIYAYIQNTIGVSVVKVENTQTFKLTPSETCNFSYYIDPNLKPIEFPGGAIVTGPETAPAEVQREQTFSNTLKVSEVNNPFIFPVENTYQIGNGQIRALSTNTIALSTGQFGEFPVYVFCTDGIYGLFIGGAEVNYASSRPISREVCNNPLSVKPIDNGVIFTTDKGVMIISGSQVKDLSESLRGEYFNVDKTALFKKAISNNRLVQLLPEVTNETLLDFIDNCIVGYNYIEHEVWFTNPQESYSYVFNQGMWYKVKQTGQVYVNDYPKQYILNSGSLVDISTAEGTATEVMFLTRPLKLQTNNFKGLVTSIIRGFMNTENKFKTVEGQTVLDYKRYSGIYVFGSYDCQRWGFLGGTEKNGELNDLGTSVERTDCKYFRIGFVGNITNTSAIEYLELEGKQSILASKQR